MRRYESVIILNPELPDDEIVGLTDRFGNVIKSNGGEIIKIEDWGSKRLAYQVNKKDKGRYILFDYVGSSALVKEVERQFKITEDVMKFLSVKLDEDVNLEAFKAAAQKEAEAKAVGATEAPAPGAEEPTEPAEAQPAEGPQVAMPAAAEQEPIAATEQGRQEHESEESPAEASEGQASSPEQKPEEV
jgi:small subunit ribosomal protein S6